MAAEVSEHVPPALLLLLLCKQQDLPALASHLNDLETNGSPDDVRGQLAACDPSGWTPLLIAARGGADPWVPILRRLLALHAALGVPPGRLPASGNGPLHVAAMHGRLEAVRALLSHHGGGSGSSSGDPDPRNTNVDTPLLFAASAGHAGAAGALLKAGADPTATNAAGLSPLLAAAGGGHALALRLLLKHAASASPEARHALLAARSRDGNSGLHYACSAGHAACVEVLLGAEGAAGDGLYAPNAAGATPLQLARRSGDAATISLVEQAHAARESQASAAAAQLTAELEAGRGSQQAAAAAVPMAAARPPRGLDDHRPAQSGSGEGDGDAPGAGSPGSAVEAAAVEEGSSPVPAAAAAGDLPMELAAAEPSEEATDGSSWQTVQRGRPGGGGGRRQAAAQHAPGGSSAAVPTAQAQGPDSGAWARRLPAAPRAAPLAARQPHSAAAPSPRHAPLARGDVQPGPPPAGGQAATQPHGDGRAAPPSAAAGSLTGVPGGATPGVPAAPGRASPLPEAGLLARAEAQLQADHPAASALDVRPWHVLGLGLEDLSVSQLEALEAIHRHALAAVAEARISLAQQQYSEAAATEQSLKAEIAELAARLRGAAA